MKIKTHTLEEYTQNGKYISFALEQIDDTMLEALFVPHRNSFFKIIIIEKGEGNCFIDFEKYNISGPSICFVFPQQIYGLRLSKETKGTVIMFDETIFCSEILSNELKEYNVDLHKRINIIDYNNNIEQFEKISGILQQLKTLEKPLNNIRKIEVKFLVKIIIFKIIDSSENANFQGVKDKDFQTYIDFRKFVDNNFLSNRKVDNYCRHLGVSSKKLNILCKRYGNKTALGFIHERLTLEIKKIFIFEEASLKEIAYNLGFDSQSAFNKYIASKFKCTPSELKDKIKSGL